jgi:hypothetical protein
MTSKNNFTVQPINHASLYKRMLIGGAIGLILISLFIFGVETKPEWGNLWRIRPLIVVPIAGATGGACNYFIVYWSKQKGLSAILAYFVSFVVFTIGLWMGIVLGLDGTLWD